MVSENHCYIEKQSCFQGIYSFLKESFKMDFDKYLFRLWDYYICPNIKSIILSKLCIWKKGIILL